MAKRTLRHIVLAWFLPVCVILLMAAGGSAQQTQHSVDYARTLWKVTDGLPEDTIQALVEDFDGSLWIGTTGGLAKTGGGRMRTPVQTPSVTCLILAADHTLWIGTDGGGLLHLVGRQAHVFAASEGLTNGFVRAIFQDSRGRIWAGTDRGLFRVLAEHLERVRLPSTLGNEAVLALAEDEQGKIWAGGSGLFAIAANGHVSTSDLPKAGGGQAITTLLQAGDHKLWAGTPSGPAIITNGKVKHVGNLHAPVRATLQASDGTLWIGTSGDGLWTYKKKRFTHVRRPGMLPSETILSLVQDHFGQIWIGTQAGLVRLEQSPLELVSLPDAPDRGSETVTGDDACNIWVAAHKIYLIRGRQVRPVDYGLPDVNVRTLLHAANGAMWFGTDTQGVYRVLRKRVDHFAAQLTGRGTRAFLEGREGEIWIASEEGVTVIGKNGTRALREKDGLAYASTRTFLQDRDGAVWIGTDRGLSVWTNGNFAHNAATRALSQEKIWSILQDRQGYLWFATREHGLLRYGDGALARFTTADALPTNSIYKLLQDRSGTFWISAPNIIFSLQESEMDALSAPQTPLNPVYYAIPSDGVQMYGGQEPAGYLAQDGTIWFPSNRGVARIAAPNARSSSWAPRIWTMLDDGHMDVLRSPSQASLNTGRISYRLVAVYLRPQDALRFRYRIDGVDAGWTQIRPDELLTYTNLRPGHYRLRVQAIDFSTTGAVSEQAVDIYKAPYVYQTVWFYLLCVFMLTLTIWFVYSLRLRQVRSRFSAVLEERNRLAREMHDTVIQGCTGLSVLIEAMQNAETNGEDRRELVTYAKELASVTVNQARQAVWAMRHGPELKISLNTAFQKIAEQVQRDQRSVCVEIQLTGDIHLPSSTTHEIVMTVREAVYNALQHSGTDRIVLRGKFAGETVVVEVEDYGIGLPHHELRTSQDGHYGILGMHERIKRVGGTLSLMSRAGGGTQVQLTVVTSTALRPESGVE